MESDCHNVIENIMDYIDNELDDKTLALLEKHLHVCPECEKFVNTYKKMLKMSGNLKNKKFVTPEIRQRLKDLIKQKINPN